MANDAETTGEAITSAEEAARRARRGYDYQDLIAAHWCLQMLGDESLLKVACETQDDVVLTWADSSHGTIPEFVQVKSDRLKQQWSVAMFCEQETVKIEKEKAATGATSVEYRKDTSIFEKNAARDNAEHRSRFRIVTRADVKELRVLTEPIGTRDNGVLTNLAKDLEKKLGGNTSLTTSDIEFWVTNAFWDVRGTDSAIFDANFRLLANQIEERDHRLIPLLDLEHILQELAQQTRNMAIGKGRIGASPNALTRGEIKAWLSARVLEVPHFLGEAETRILLRAERASLARCAGLWVALGISHEEAQALARQPEIGARDEFFSPLGSGFFWITATYGAGKSLAVERLYQRKLADYIAKRDYRVPIFLRAYSVSGILQNEVEARLIELNRSRDQTSLYLIVDAVDEADSDRRQHLLQECYEISQTWPNSTIIATSISLPYSFETFLKPLPKLTREATAQIVTRFAGYTVTAWSVGDRLGADSGLALLCVLYGLALRETTDATPSKGELLHRLVDSARKRSGRDADEWAVEADRLSRVALMATDLGGGPVALSDIGLSAVELTPLYATRLIVEEAGKVVFTVATMRLWFAARALEKGWVNAPDLAKDIPRARHWIGPMAIFVATGPFEQTRLYMDELAKLNPSGAAKIIADATTQWGRGTPREPSKLLEFAQRVRRCLAAWLEGVQPLGPVCSFTDRQGGLLKVAGSCEVPYTVIAFSRDVLLPDVSVLPSDWKNNGEYQVSYYLEPDEPAHLWRTTQEMVAKDVKKWVQQKSWARRDDVFIHEDVWNCAAGWVQGARLFAHSLEWEVIDHHQQFFQQMGTWQWICAYRASHPGAFYSPHPPADNRDPSVCWIPDFYSASAALANADSIYSSAVAGYQRIVRAYFPNFVNDFKHSAWWPYQMVGIVISSDGGRRDWRLHSHVEPVSTEGEAGTRFQLGTREKHRALFNPELIREKAIQLRPHASPWAWDQDSIINLHDSHPATRLVEDWLISDLMHAGWGC